MPRKRTEGPANRRTDCPSALADAVRRPGVPVRAQVRRFRGVLYLTGGNCHFRSKRGNVLRRFEQLCYWVRDELVEREGAPA